MLGGAFAAYGLSGFIAWGALALSRWSLATSVSACSASLRWSAGCLARVLQP